MVDEKRQNEARQVYDTLCQTLDEKGCKHERDEEHLSVAFGIAGDDLPINLHLFVDPVKGILRILSRMPFEIPEDKRVEVGLAVNVANFGMVNGSFDYEISDGSLFFRMANCFAGSLFSANLLEHMIALSIRTIDIYNDRFLMLAKGMIDFPKFMQLEAGEGGED